MKHFKNLFLDLYNSNSESEVIEIMNRPVFKNPENWLPYGGNKGNFGTFESQQNHPVPALIEKITNSIDATLIKECKISGIDPKSSKAPRTMAKAVEEFYKIPDGEIGKLSTNERRKLAENIQVIALGDKMKPSIVIYDNGEGQNPDNFSNTFLSLHNNNKTNIHFVQGKYNMGSTGAVVFCGEKKFQLIASKKNPLLDDANGELGFTLVRRHELTSEEEKNYGKATWYEYFAPEGQIASFPIDELDLGLYNRNFTSGSIVKLYSYELPKGSRSNITLDLWRDLNQFMYSIPLPISLYEKRDYITKNPSKIVLGNKTRITIDSRDNVKEIISFNLSKEGMGNIPIDVIIFDSKIEHNEFIKNKSIIFTQNGQVHGYEGQSFISQELGYSLIKKNTLIHVNCTDIPTSYRQDLFMANRTHLKNGHKSEELISEIINILKSSTTLKEINNAARNSLLQDSESDKDLLETMISKLPVDKDVLNLLKKNGSLDFLKLHGDTINNSNDKNFEKPKLNRLPSVFALTLDKNEEVGKIYKTIALKSKGTIKINTDVENDYLFRPEEVGKLDVQVLPKEKPGIKPIPNPDNSPQIKKINDILNVSTEGPTDGVIKLIIEPNEKAKAGDEVEVRATLSDSTGKTFQCMFDVKVTPEISKPKKTEKKATETFPNLPIPRKAYETAFDEHGLSWNSPELNWNGHDIVKVITSSDDKSDLMVAGIIVNMDSIVLKNFFSKNKINTEKEIRFNKDKYFLSIYLHSLFLFSILQKMRTSDEKLKAIEVDEFVSSMIKPYANFLMYENYHITKMAFSEN